MEPIVNNDYRLIKTLLTKRKKKENVTLESGGRQEYCRRRIELSATLETFKTEHAKKPFQEGRIQMYHSSAGSYGEGSSVCLKGAKPAERE